MNVGHLKKQLEGFSDDMDVCIRLPDLEANLAIQSIGYHTKDNYNDTAFFSINATEKPRLRWGMQRSKLFSGTPPPAAVNSGRGE